MAVLNSRKITIAFDMYGCPNQCKHCWLGNLPNKLISMDKVKEIVYKFQNYRKQGENESFFDDIKIFTWMREPDYGNNYRELYSLEKELSTSKTTERFELMSIWRLCRDKEYVHWAKSVGIKKCQISFFGMEENTNFIVGRKTAFRDNITATELLLKNGILPRWQIFLTQESVNELAELEKLIKENSLEEKCKNLGMEFECFLQNPTPDGNAFHLDAHRITKDDIEKIPGYFIEKTLKFTGIKNLSDHLGNTESNLLNELKTEETAPNINYDLCFYITGDLNIYTNYAELMPWWRLGNLELDTVTDIIETFEKNRNIGLNMNHNVKISEMAEKFGEKSEKLYRKSDLILKLMRIYGENEWKNAGKKQAASILFNYLQK